jgi:hypothetical protein
LAETCARRLACRLALTAAVIAGGLVPLARGPVAVARADDVEFEVAVTGAGSVGLTVTNFGFFGNNFNDRSPSFEYPLGSEVEHMVRGGVWVGAVRADTGDTLVATGTTDGSVGGRTDAATEWRPASPMMRRSILIADRNYSPDAISEEDLVTTYNDTLPIDRDGEDHRPLNVEVTQRVLGWSYDPADAFVIVEVEVKNLNEDVDLLNLHIGMYSELASGFKGRYEDWPPGGAWFDQKILDFDPERLLIIEHHVTFDQGQAPQYGAISLLGTRPDSVETMQPGFRWWAWDPGALERDQDVERYAELSTPGFMDVSVIVLQDDPAELLTVGPWPLVAPGESVTAVYAFIGGINIPDVQARADWAREAFRRDYIVPLPPPSPRLFVDPRPHAITLRWDASPESVRDPSTNLEDFEGYRVYVSRGDEDGIPGIEWSLVAQADLRDELGFDSGLDHLSEPYTGEGQNYDYRYNVRSLKDGHKYWVAVTSYDTGDPETPSLESGIGQNRTLCVPGTESDPGDERKVVVFPNPYRGRASWDGVTERERFVWFANLPPRAEIRIYSLAGDLVDTIQFESDSYNAANAAGVNDPIGENPVLSGGIAAWDLLSWNSQPVATGLYVFSVRDLDTGDLESGRLMVIK